jgi:hypothetical protein
MEAVQRMKKKFNDNSSNENYLPLLAFFERPRSRNNIKKASGRLPERKFKRLSLEFATIH